MSGGPLAVGSRTVFPQHMSEAAVEKAIREAYRYGKRISTQGDRILVQGEADGITIVVAARRVSRGPKRNQTAVPGQSPSSVHHGIVVSPTLELKS